MSGKLGAIRLTKEFKAISERKSLENFIAMPDPKNLFEWHFLIFGLKDCPYEDGFYHGKLSFPPEYPHKPPSIIMFTPSGRFQVKTQICMSFSNFHPELWNPAWGVSTIIIGLISFMNTEEMTTGGMRAGFLERRAFAAKSLLFNMDPA